MLFTKLQNLFYFLKKKILTIFGDVWFFSYPFWFVYHPNKFKITGTQFDEIKNHLRDGDVLLRRYDNYLDTGFIPGYWNHASIFYKDAIYHAIAEGVVKEHLFNFCQTDHILILRPKYFDIRDLVFYLKTALGKPYDFNFQFDNHDRYSCTELVSHFFSRYTTFEKTKYIGEPVIIPDTFTKNEFFTEIFKS